MNVKRYVDANWEELRGVIDATYANAKNLPIGQERDDSECLRDYAENISWSDALARLLERETRNEKQHRANRPAVPGFSAETAAKLILMIQVAEGAKRKTMPRATCFLVFRQTAIEAQVLGAICAAKLHPAWLAAVTQMDYAKLMEGGRR